MEAKGKPVICDLEDELSVGHDDKEELHQQCTRWEKESLEQFNVVRPDSRCLDCAQLNNSPVNDGKDDDLHRMRRNSQTDMLQPSSDFVKPDKNGNFKAKRTDKSKRWKCWPWENRNYRKKKKENNLIIPRSLGRRSSVENFGLFGLLTPALVLLPQANGADALTGQFADLKGEHRELKLAAAHIEDAFSGRGKYGKARSFFKSKFAQRCFKILHNKWYYRIFLAVIIIHAVLIFVEPPSAEQEMVYLSVYIVEGCCISLYIFDLFVRIKFLNWGIFWSLKTVESYWNGVQFVLVCMFVVDFLILVLTRFIDEYVPQPFRCLRLVMLLCKVKSIRHIFAVLTTIGTRLLKVFLIILVFIVIFATVGVHLYEDVYNTVRPNNETNSNDWCCIQKDSDEEIYKGTFDHVGQAMLRLFVLLSTENYPEIMLPALRRQRVNFLFFAVFLFVGIFLLAILLAIVVDSYWLFAKKHVKKARARERAELAKAWNLLDPLGLGSLSIYDEQFKNLFRILKPNNTEEQNQMLIELLDSNMDGEVDSFEWTTALRQALQAEFEVDTDDDDIEGDTGKISSRLKLYVKKIVESTIFSKAMLLLIFIHCVFFTLKWRGQSRSVKLTVQIFRTCIVVIFMFEALLRIFALGKNILHKLEIIDLILVFVAVLTNIIWYIFIEDDVTREEFVTVSGVAVFFRLFLNSAETRKGFYWFLNIAPVMIDLMILLFVIMYLLSAVGMELFHTYPASDSKIYPDNCGLGFKTFYCSFLAQFQMMTTSNWHEIMNMVQKETKSNASYLYFCISYIIITMTVMNLFTAIAIEAANKLALSEEERKESVNQQNQFNYEKKHAKHPKDVAKTALNNIAKKLFASARIEDIHQRDRRTSVVIANPTITGTITGSNTIILQSPRKTINSQKGESHEGSKSFKDEQADDVFLSESSESEEEDYTGLGPKEKRERQLKKRMRRKRRARRHKELQDELEAERQERSAWQDVKEEVRVVTAFKGMKETDLSLSVGDTVVILEKTDDWFRGEFKGKTGWFPASHVVSWAAKQHIAVTRSEVRSEVVVEEQSGVAENYTPEEIINIREGDIQAPIGTSSTERNLAPVPYNLQPLSPPRPRLKMKKAGDWTRNILGDITVMNADEMRELNKVMRAEMRAPSLVGRGRNRQQPGFLGSNLNLGQRDHGVLLEEHGELEDGVRLRSESLETQRRPLSGTAGSSKAQFATPDVSARQGNSTPVPNTPVASKRPKSPLRPLSASQPSRPVTPTRAREIAQRQRAPTSSSHSSLDGPSSPKFEHDPSTQSVESKEEHPNNKQFVVSVDAGTPSPPDTLVDDSPVEKEPEPEEEPVEKGHLNVDKPTVSEAKPAAKKKAKSGNGEMPSWMLSFVESNNLVVGNDVKLENERAKGK